MNKIKNLNLNEIAKLVTIKFGDMEQDYRMPWVGEFWLAEDDVGETITFEKYQCPQNGWVTLYVIEDMGAEQVTRWYA